MTLKISVLDGPTKGQSFEFADDVDVVEIGRDPDACKVVFPPNFTSVGRRHVTIRRVAGRYKLETNLQNPVLIDGREPFDEEPLGTTQEIRLGRSGPRLKVETVFLNALPATDPGNTLIAPSARAHRQRRATGGILAAVVLLVLAVAGIAGYFYWENQQAAERQRVAAAEAAERLRVAEERQEAAEVQLQTLVAEMEKVENAIPEAQPVQPVEPAAVVEPPPPMPPTVLTPDTMATIARSVYLVMVQDSTGRVTPQATAWVVADGVFATNAHVAAIADELTEGQTMVVRSTIEPYDTIRIERAVKHPDWERFSAEWLEQSPVRVGAEAFASFVDLSYLGYDVGLLYAEPGSVLQPPLTIADAETLHTLRPGSAIGFVGFPMEQIMGGGVSPTAPVPQVQIGSINAVTDNFLMPGTDATRQLVQHNMVSAGGASGSPIVNAAGEVVAVLSAGNYIFLDDGTRVPNASSIEYAQRADLVLELLDDQVAALQPARDEFWAAGFATFDRPEDTVPEAMLASWAANFTGGIEPTEIGHYEGTFETQLEDGTYAVELTDVLERRGFYFASAVSRSRADIDLAFTRDDEVLISNVEYDWYPTASWTMEDDVSLDIVLTSYASEPVDYDLTVYFIPLGREVNSEAPANPQ